MCSAFPITQTDERSMIIARRRTSTGDIESKPKLMIETFSRHWNARNILFISSRALDETFFLLFSSWGSFFLIIIIAGAKQVCAEQSWLHIGPRRRVLHYTQANMRRRCREWAIKWRGEKTFRIYTLEMMRDRRLIIWHVKYLMFFSLFKLSSLTFDERREVWWRRQYCVYVVRKKTAMSIVCPSPESYSGDEWIRKLDSNSKSIFNINT